MTAIENRKVNSMASHASALLKINFCQLTLFNSLGQTDYVVGEYGT